MEKIVVLLVSLSNALAWFSCFQFRNRTKHGATVATAKPPEAQHAEASRLFGLEFVWCIRVWILVGFSKVS